MRAGEQVPSELAVLLDPVDMSSMHEYVLPANVQVELHYHDHDEYWLFTEGHPTVPLRLPDGATGVYRLAPGDMVVTLRGVEHTLSADHALRYFQFSSTHRSNARSGHLICPPVFAS